MSDTNSSMSLAMDNSGNMQIIDNSYNPLVLFERTTGNVRINNNAWIRAKDYAGTGVVNMFKVNEDNEIDVGGTLNIGTLSLTEDSGAVTLVNMPVSSTPTAGDEMSYSFSVDSDVIAKVYAEADGTGGIQNPKLIVNGPIEAASLIQAYAAKTD